MYKIIISTRKDMKVPSEFLLVNVVPKVLNSQIFPIISTTLTSLNFKTEFRWPNMNSIYG